MAVDDLAAELLAASLTDDPIGASLTGIPGYDDQLPDFSIAGEKKSVERLSSLAARAEAENQSGLSETDHQTLDFVRHLAAVQRDAARIPLIEWNVGSFHAAPVAAVLALLPKVALDTDARADGYLVRLAALPALLEVAAGRHLDGIAAKRFAVGRLVRSAIEQLDVVLGDDLVAGLRRGRSQADDRYAEQVDGLIDAAVRPALAKYRQQLTDTVVPSARDDAHVGLCWLPDGKDMYRVLVRLHTSTDRSPEDLHESGKEIVEQVGAEFKQIGKQLWGTAELAEIFDKLESDPSLRYQSTDEIVAIGTAAVRRAEAAAPNWFGILPEEPCQVDRIPEAEEAGSAPAYYIQGAVDGSRPGTFYLNTFEPQARSRHLAEAVAYHEAVPGHHFQLTIALNQTSLPLARRLLGDTACAEGWGLYAERLADEMGLYTDDVARLGMLSTDAWRACRLVVDTGMHHFGWSRGQAIDWMKAHAPLPLLEIETEVDRYITYPGQALSYMVGRLELLALRRLAAERLGASFSVRDFHDLVLSVGPLPLTAMRGAVERWIEARSS